MKLSQVLSHINQVERSKFINCLDKICSVAIKTDAELADNLSNIEGQLRSASGSEITQLFTAATSHFKDFVREQIALGGSQVALLINILSRDGNSVARISWIESLYANERQRINDLASVLLKEIEVAAELDDYGRGTRLSIYKDCFETAYTNDIRLNREAKVTDDERMILNTLSERLGLSADESFAVENIVLPVPRGNVQEALNVLREMGLIFVNKNRAEVFVADEVVSIFHEIQNRELPDKHVLRILRSLSDAELSNILRRHEQKTRSVTRQDKIKYITHAGISIRSVLSRDMFGSGDTLSQRKDRLKLLIDDLDMTTSRLGVTLDDRIDVVVESLTAGVEAEFNALSASGFKELVNSLSETVPSVIDRLRCDFEIEEIETIEPDSLRALGISPLDILYLYTNDEVKKIRGAMGLSKRNNPRSSILESFASANDRLIENYGMLARRDLSGLQSVGIDIRESEIGLKFEEVTRTIFEQLGMQVDEDLRKQISTAKDKADIIVSLGGDDVIVGEVKSYKNGDFPRYSSTSRQVKSYVNRCEANGKRVAQTLIVAPSFSQDFIDSAEMDADINISLLEADGLKKILTAYKSRRNPKFSEKLLTKGGLLKADLIAKTI
ncbi:FIG00786943: hypothetical protein [hydrothermal vent metagenome]|uniref:Uncharacterized protein n=1 Tax=hydrothermal vent metagenome TaxID=652676 RepID=A0A3B0WGD4_9ZZZZ